MRQTRPAPNSGFALWGLTHFVETFVQDSTFVLRMDICAKNPPQRKAANRYLLCWTTSQQDNLKLRSGLSLGDTYGKSFYNLKGLFS